MVFMFTNGLHFVIAESHPEAKSILGKEFSNLSEKELEGEGWEQVRNDLFFTLAEDDGTEAKKTIQEWVDSCGSGYFASLDDQGKLKAN